MIFRITDDVKQKDIDEIYNMLKEYNLSNREESENLRKQGIGTFKLQNFMRN